jgi:drug/metabolite transporter (DMT)-like permease
MWPLLSLGNAFFESLHDAFSKKMATSHQVAINTFMSRLTISILLVGVWFLFDRYFYHSWHLYRVALISGFLNAWAFRLYIRALKEADLSVALPLLKFSPVWTLVTGPFINGDSVSLVSAIGVFVMIAGTYAGNISEKKNGFLEPLLHLLKSPGTRAMLGVSLIWSVSGPFDKEGIKASSSLYYIILLNTSLMLLLLPAAVRELYRQRRITPLAPLPLIGASLTGTASVIFQMHAFAQAPVALAVSIKRVSTLFGMLWGKLFFDETHLRQRVIGAIVTLIGMCLVVIGK